MATFDLPILNDLMEIESVNFDLQRQDSMSGSGDARYWSAEFTDPLWKAEINLAPGYNEDVKAVAARIRFLRGTANNFFLVDPLSKYPRNDPKGAALIGRTILLSSIVTDRNVVSFTGFPANFALATGDKFQINYTIGSVDKSAFIEVSFDNIGSGTGAINNVIITPNLPLGIVVGATAIFAKPACRMLVVPDSFNAGTGTGPITTGLALKALQKK